MVTLREVKNHRLRGTYCVSESEEKYDMQSETEVAPTAEAEVSYDMDGSEVTELDMEAILARIDEYEQMMTLGMLEEVDSPNE